jgi:hypothetical protein
MMLRYQFSPTSLQLGSEFQIRRLLSWVADVLSTVLAMHFPNADRGVLADTAQPLWWDSSGW